MTTAVARMNQLSSFNTHHSSNSVKELIIATGRALVCVCIQNSFYLVVVMYNNTYMLLYDPQQQIEALFKLNKLDLDYTTLQYKNTIIIRRLVIISSKIIVPTFLLYVCRSLKCSLSHRLQREYCTVVTPPFLSFYLIVFQHCFSRIIMIIDSSVLASQLAVVVGSMDGLSASFCCSVFLRRRRHCSCVIFHRN